MLIAVLPALTFAQELLLQLTSIENSINTTDDIVMKKEAVAILLYDDQLVIGDDAGEHYYSVLDSDKADVEIKITCEEGVTFWYNLIYKIARIEYKEEEKYVVFYAIEESEA